MDCYCRTASCPWLAISLQGWALLIGVFKDTLRYRHLKQSMPSTYQIGEGQDRDNSDEKEMNCFAREVELLSF